jgi:hypothetical protein
MTLSMTWITPFVATMSVAVTSASLITIYKCATYGIGFDGLCARMVNTADARIVAAAEPNRIEPTGTRRLSQVSRAASQRSKCLSISDSDMPNLH